MIKLITITTIVLLTYISESPAENIEVKRLPDAMSLNDIPVTPAMKKQAQEECKNILTRVLLKSPEIMRDAKAARTEDKTIAILYNNCMAQFGPEFN
jgi:hypothetical protein